MQSNLSFPCCWQIRCLLNMTVPNSLGVSCFFFFLYFFFPIIKHHLVDTATETFQVYPLKKFCLEILLLKSQTDDTVRLWSEMIIPCKEIAEPTLKRIQLYNSAWIGFQVITTLLNQQALEQVWMTTNQTQIDFDKNKITVNAFSFCKKKNKKIYQF